MMDFSELQNFVNTVNTEEIEKQIAAEGKGGGNFFQPGTYTLKIDSVDYHKNKVTGSIACAKDTSWISIVVNFKAEDGRSKQHFIQVPTKKLTYNEGASKSPYFVFRNLQKFMGALGVELTVENAGEVIPAFFNGDSVNLKTPEKLIGQTITLDIGFKGKHVARQEDGTYQINLGKGKMVLDTNDKPMVFPTADAAKVYSVETGLGELQSFPEITNFHAKDEYVSTAPTKQKLKAAW